MNKKNPKKSLQAISGLISGNRSDTDDTATILVSDDTQMNVTMTAS